MQAHGHGGSNGAAGVGVGKPGMRVRWRHSRSILKAGLEAALRADPQMVERCQPKTGYGLLVRGLLLEAGKGKAAPLKQVMSLIDWDGEDHPDAVEDFPDEGRRDWSPDGVWETMPEEPAPASEEVEEEDGPNRQELKRRLTRLVEAGQHEHAARIMAAIRDPHYTPQPIPSG